MKVLYLYSTLQNNWRTYREQNVLTLLEKRILNFIHAFIIKHGHSPTLVEIGEAMDINSKGTIHRYIQNLRNKNMLAQNERGWRGIRLADDALIHSTTLPLVGRIAAGQPIEAIQDHEEINLSDMFVGKDRYALQIKGDSMIDIGILDGDIVIMKPTREALNGELVAVWLNDRDETTLKYFYKENGSVRLQPANPTMQPILINDPSIIEIQGKVIMVIRQIKG